VGVAVGVACAAHAVLEGHRHQAADRLVAVSPVVVAADPEAVALQVADGELQGFGAAVGQQPPHLGAAAGGQQRDALGGAEAVVEGLHPLIDPLPPMLPGRLEGFAVQVTRGDLEDLAAQPLDRLDLDPPGAAQPAGCLDRADVALERLAPGELLQVLDAVVGGPGLEGLQQRPGGQLGTRVGPQERCTALLPGGGIEALEHRPHLLGAGDPLQTTGLGGAADEPAW
jgi:hypothetical protein